MMAANATSLRQLIEVMQVDAPRVAAIRRRGILRHQSMVWPRADEVDASHEARAPTDEVAPQAGFLVESGGHDGLGDGGYRYGHHYLCDEMQDPMGDD